MSSEREPERRWYRIGAAVFAFSCVAVIGITLTYFVVRDISVGEPWMFEVFRAHPAAVLGVPFIAMAAFCIVVVLRIASGRIEFEGFGFKFAGASGEAIIWVICFLSITTAVKLLW